ncbi:MAG: nucleotidyl transferase AbiEii/AbiGii toxin family protein [Dehalococcoidia bacterium]|nr:nucleotidyl transferase AbiEii/AbiGii toxin family protein [Dehalococcoidia bacterium]
MTTPSYPGPPANRASLEQRLRNICAGLGLNELRIRTSLAHTVVAQMLPAGVVKGGAAIKLRVGDQASRLTRDLDAVRTQDHTVESYAAELAKRLDEGWHGFTGRLVTREPADPPDVPTEYVMHPFDVKLAYMSQSYLTVQLELGHDEVGSTREPRMVLDAGIVDVLTRLGLPSPNPVPVLAVEHQIAQKLHACTTPERNGGNERAHDLVDLQILVEAEPPDLHELAIIGRRLFAARRAAPWPPVVRIWPGWEERYADAAEGLEVRPLAEAVEWLSGLIDAAEQAASR